MFDYQRVSFSARSSSQNMDKHGKAECCAVATKAILGFEWNIRVGMDLINSPFPSICKLSSANSVQLAMSHPNFGWTKWNCLWYTLCWTVGPYLYSTKTNNIWWYGGMVHIVLWQIIATHIIYIYIHMYISTPVNLFEACLPQTWFMSYSPHFLFQSQCLMSVEKCLRMCIHIRKDGLIDR